MGIRYDFHLHSCLSPCADDDMTPYHLANMAALAGLHVIALTDHNSCKNCGAAMEAARAAGVLAIPGMELCTAEEIHIVCLFPDLGRAMAFDRRVYPTIFPAENDPAVFGNQLVMDSADTVVGTEPALLIGASSISVTDAPRLAAEYGGVCFPAHIDRPSYSILSVLGDIPPECGFAAYELSRRADGDALRAKHGILGGMTCLVDSDAHSLGDIGAAGGELACAADIGAIFSLLRGRRVAVDRRFAEPQS